MLVALGSFAVSQQTRAACASPDPGCPGGNLAEGYLALGSLTSGLYNTGIGAYSLLSITDGKFCTAVGAGTLFTNTGSLNTATGAGVLLSNTTGDNNTADGAFALFSNTDGHDNTAIGYQALFSNIGTIGGAGNTAIGSSALFHSVTGSANTAVGFGALFFNTGGDNTAVGGGALANATGNGNVAVGAFAGNQLTAGDNNVFIGKQAGGSFTSAGDNKIFIGSQAGSAATSASNVICIGASGENVDNHTYIGNINSTSVSGGNADFVTIDLTTGLLGYLSSSCRYKEDIKPIDKASEALFALKPVSYRYKKDIDRTQSLDYGLIAEDVAKVDPNLAIRDENGQIESVRYNAINAMLLNEFLKEHKIVEAQHGTIAELKSMVAQQQKDMEVLSAELKEQSTQIQKISAQVEANRTRPQLAKTP
jgi:uncharacterized coiled-coil protein SlyX